jgi:hypothetical protein
MGVQPRNFPTGYSSSGRLPLPRDAKPNSIPARSTLQRKAAAGTFDLVTRPMGHVYMNPLSGSREIIR